MININNLRDYVEGNKRLTLFDLIDEDAIRSKTEEGLWCFEFSDYRIEGELNDEGLCEWEGLDIDEDSDVITDNMRLTFGLNLLKKAEEEDRAHHTHRDYIYVETQELDGQEYFIAYHAAYKNEGMGGGICADADGLIGVFTDIKCVDEYIKSEQITTECDESLDQKRIDFIIEHWDPPLQNISKDDEHENITCDNTNVSITPLSDQNDEVRRTSERDEDLFFIPNNFYNHPRYISANDQVKRNIFGKSEASQIHRSRVSHVFSARLGAEASVIRQSLKNELTILSFTLKDAYVKTSYLIDNPEIFLRIGEKNNALAALYLQRRCDKAVFITAENPDSVEMDPETNASKMQDLSTFLRSENYTFYVGRGVSDETPDYYENSYLVLGMECDFAVWLAAKFGQMAFVYCGGDSVPKLVVVGGSSAKEVHLKTFI